MKLWIDYTNRRAMDYHAMVAELSDIARVSDVEIAPARDGLAVQTRLYLTPSKRWQRTSASPFAYSERLGRNRLVNAVCWHGHYRFLSELFLRHPNARVISAFDTWRNAEDFANRAESSGQRNIGAPIAPMQMREACLCSENGDYIGTAYDVLTREDTVSYNGFELGNVRIMRQSDIAACPHCIFAPEHYRADGSCRCDDPAHTEMAGWGYSFDGSQWVSESPVSFRGEVA